MITIITEPSLNPVYRAKRALINNTKRLLNKPISVYKGRIVTGHFAVVRSLLNGLDELKIEHNYNPRNTKHFYNHVHVVAGVEALKMCIKLKKKGLVKKLTAGPNIVISSSDYHYLIADRAVDFYLVNSWWTKENYELDCPQLKGRLSYFPSGIDVSQWNVAENKKTKSVLFYIKRPSVYLLNKCKDILVKHNYNVIEFYYGRYTLNEFNEILQTVDFVVYFVEQESQGLALFEIWATNTPTLVWNPGYWTYLPNKQSYRCSSAPYLTDETGLFFYDEKEFDEIIKDKLQNANFNPREWVLKNGTDIACTKYFLNEVNR